MSVQITPSDLTVVAGGHHRDWSVPWPGYTPIDITPFELSPAALVDPPVWITDPVATPPADHRLGPTPEPGTGALPPQPSRVAAQPHRAHRQVGTQPGRLWLAARPHLAVTAISEQLAAETDQPALF